MNEYQWTAVVLITLANILMALVARRNAWHKGYMAGYQDAAEYIKVKPKIIEAREAMRKGPPPPIKASVNPDGTMTALESTPEPGDVKPQ